MDDLPQEICLMHVEVSMHGCKGVLRVPLTIESTKGIPVKAYTQLNCRF